MTKLIVRTISYCAVICAWFWVMIFKIPLLLTAGTLSSFTGITLLALCVVVPTFWVWKFIQGKIVKESPK